MKPLPGDRKPKFKRHIETRSRRIRCVQLDTREIVERVLATLDQFQDPIQAARPARDSQRSARGQTKCCQTSDIGEK
jgi:hypothetical protein